MDSSHFGRYDSSNGGDWKEIFAKMARAQMEVYEAEKARKTVEMEAEVEYTVVSEAISAWEAEDAQPERRKRQRLDLTRPASFAETLYGQMILHPDVNNPRKKMGKEFRRKFRLPFPLFQHLVALCREHGIFGQIKMSKIPIEAKVLIGLRVLGSGAHTSILADCTSLFVGQSTIASIVHEFVAGVTEHLFPIYVRFPTGEELKPLMEVYSRLGLPGACGSIDCTHIRWTLCPKKFTHACTGIP